MFAEITMLITNGTEEDLATLRSIARQDQEDLKQNGDFTQFEALQRYLNGYGRILFYQVSSKDEIGNFNPKVYGNHKVLTEMWEGSFKQGLLDGFGRKIHTNLAQLPNYRGEIRIGYFKEGWRFGKQQYYKNELLT